MDHGGVSMNNAKSDVSITVVRRLPRYYQYLKDLETKDVDRISSKQLSELMGLTASQIRQDLNSFGAYGQQGYGYRVTDLKKAIRNILGLSRTYKSVIIGAGNLGRAISNFERLGHENIEIIAMFDNDPEKIGKEVGNVPVKDTADFIDFVKKEGVSIAVLSVPREVGQQLADMIVASGIKGILNLVPLDLKVPQDVRVENVNITDSILTLTYYLDDVSVK